MRAMIVYDTYFGNTKKVAEIIKGSFGGQMEVELVNVIEGIPTIPSDLDLLIVGFPTRAFRPTASVVKFLKKIPVKVAKGLKAASFDTRIAIEKVKNSRILPFFMKTFGYASEKIARKLKKKGCTTIIYLAGFFVDDAEGPLSENEEARIIAWAEEIFDKL